MSRVTHQTARNAYCSTGTAVGVHTVHIGKLVERKPQQYILDMKNYPWCLQSAEPLVDGTLGHVSLHCPLFHSNFLCSEPPPLCALNDSCSLPPCYCCWWNSSSSSSSSSSRCSSATRCTHPSNCLGYGELCHWGIVTAIVAAVTVAAVSQHLTCTRYRTHSSTGNKCSILHEAQVYRTHSSTGEIYSVLHTVERSTRDPSAPSSHPSSPDFLSPPANAPPTALARWAKSQA